MVKVSLEGALPFLGSEGPDWAAAERAHRTLVERSGAGKEFTGWLDLAQRMSGPVLQDILAAAQRIRSQGEALLVVGIGGSYLGARAAIEFLGGAHYNDLAPLKVLFVGNSICPEELQHALDLCKDKDVCVNVISKSGTTTEPAIAFRVFKKYMEERYGKQEAAKRIFATTDRSRGTLKELSTKEGYETFVVPDDVGGRYSVLTAVGLLPIAAAGFDTDKILAGARKAQEAFTKEGNVSDRYAAIRNALYRKGKKIELFGPSQAKAVAAEHGIRLLEQLPIDPVLSQEADLGKIEFNEGTQMESILGVLDDLGLKAE